MLRRAATHRVGSVLRVAGQRRSSQLAQAPAPEMAAFAMQSNTRAVRNNWSREEVAAIYSMPFTELLFRAASVHRAHWDPLEVQRCTLLSIKTGGCTVPPAGFKVASALAALAPTRPPAAPNASARWLGADLWAREGHPRCAGAEGETAAVLWWAEVAALSHHPPSSHRPLFPSSLTPSSLTPLSPLTALCHPVASQEDCKYCAQSTRHKTKVKATPMMQKDEVRPHPPTYVPALSLSRRCASPSPSPSVLDPHPHHSPLAFTLTRCSRRRGARRWQARRASAWARPGASWARRRPPSSASSAW